MRHCYDCRHFRSKYSAPSMSGPEDYDEICNVLEGDAEAPKAAKLRSYKPETLNHIRDHGGCPSFEKWLTCEVHGLPIPPMADYGLASGSCFNSKGKL